MMKFPKNMMKLIKRFNKKNNILRKENMIYLI